MEKLNKKGVVELNDIEYFKINAGCGGICTGFVAGLLISALNHWPDIKKGISDGLSDALS